MRINNNIRESYCSYNVCKLLKEKEFNVCPEYISPTDYVWGFIVNEDDEENESPKIQIAEFQWEDAVQDIKILRPTHNVALEWLKVNFNIWIEIKMGKDSESFWFDYDIFSLKLPIKDSPLGENVDYEDPEYSAAACYSSMIDNPHEIFHKRTHKSSQEAIEEALLYTLKNLI